jgi:CHAD domain-containing protein
MYQPNFHLKLYLCLKPMKHPTIHTSETFNQNMVRLMLFYNRLAIQYLQRENNVHENIHQTRLCFKRMRSFLRLGRSGPGKQIYRHYNDFYRDQSRSLSQLRDLTALTETLPQFIKTRRVKASKNLLLRFRQSLLNRRKQQLDHIIDSNIKANVIRALEEKTEEITKWGFEGDAAQIFSAGAQRIYGRGKRLFLETIANPSDHNMHEWRKQVKYFWYHLVVLTPVWPAIMTPWAKELQTLSQLLGKHHDLVLLESAIDQLEIQANQQQIANNLKKSIRLRKIRLEKKSLGFGRKIYAEGTAELGKRLYAYWE